MRSIEFVILFSVSQQRFSTKVVYTLFWKWFANRATTGENLLDFLWTIKLEIMCPFSTFAAWAEGVENSEDIDIIGFQN